jgi:hypothetical protein
MDIDLLNDTSRWSQVYMAGSSTLDCHTYVTLPVIVVEQEHQDVNRGIRLL